MKTLLLLLPFVFIFQNEASARARIPFGKGEKLDLVKDLPDTDDYRLGDSSYLDLAQFYEVYTVAWVSIWTTKEPILVGYNKTTDEYYDLTDEELEGILAENELKKEDLLGLSLWTKFGGKGIILIILGLILYSYLGGKDEKTETEKTEA